MCVCLQLCMWFYTCIRSKCLYKDWNFWPSHWPFGLSSQEKGGKCLREIPFMRLESGLGLGACIVLIICISNYVIKRSLQAQWDRYVCVCVGGGVKVWNWLFLVGRGNHSFWVAGVFMSGMRYVLLCSLSLCFVCFYHHNDEAHTYPALPDRDDTSNHVAAASGKNRHAQRQCKESNARKAAGPERVAGKVLNACADQLTEVFATIFNFLLLQSVVPKWAGSTAETMVWQQ